MYGLLNWGSVQFLDRGTREYLVSINQFPLQKLLFKLPQLP